MKTKNQLTGLDAFTWLEARIRRDYNNVGFRHSHLVTSTEKETWYQARAQC
jgi:disulfide oxidoreductase YuzD